MDSQRKYIGASVDEKFYKALNKARKIEYRSVSNFIIVAVEDRILKVITKTEEDNNVQ